MTLISIETLVTDAKKIFLNQLLVALLVGFSAQAYSIGHRVVQTVKTQSVETNDADPKSNNSKLKVEDSELEWLVQDQKFKLISKTTFGQSEYIFTGQIFYICGRLSEKSIDATMKKSLSFEAIEILKKGTCQEVPSNFLVRFFLSPLSSIESVDLSDGLKLTLSLTGYKTADIEADAETLKIAKTAGQSCKGGERHFTIAKSPNLSSGKEGIGSLRRNSKVVTTESFCLTSEIDWRGTLLREVTKSVLRQPKGAQMMGTLRDDYLKVKGLPLSARIEQSIEYEGKYSFKNTIKISTKFLEKKTFPQNTFQIPNGYKIFSSQSAVASVVKAGDSSKKGAVEKAEEKSQPGNMLDFIHSAVFCGLARGICLQ